MGVYIHWYIEGQEKRLSRKIQHCYCNFSFVHKHLPATGKHPRIANLLQWIYAVQKLIQRIDLLPLFQWTVDKIPGPFYLFWMDYIPVPGLKYNRIKRSEGVTDFSLISRFVER